MAAGRERAIGTRGIALVPSSLRVSRRRSLVFSFAAPAAVIVATADGCIRLFDRAAERTLGCSADEAIGQHVGRFIPASLLDQPRAIASVEAIRADGERFAADVTTVRIDINGAPAYAIALRDLTEQHRSHAALRRLHASFEQQTRRIAQSLHDEAGQLLTAAHIALDELAVALPSEACDQVNVVRQHLDRMEDQLRHIAHELRPRILDAVGLIPAIEFLAQGVEKRWRITVVVSAALQRRMPAEVETAVYRLVQEALSNATKHARARRIEISLKQTPDMLRCTIEDDGVGFDISMLSLRFEKEGLGLVGIRDQVEILGGTLKVESAPHCGTRLTILIPVES